MITLDLNWLRTELLSQIDNCVDDSVFVHSDVWKIMEYDDKEKVKRAAKKRDIKLVVGVEQN